MKSSVRDMTTGSPTRLILKFAAPLLFGFLFQQLYSFVDTAIVGRVLGEASLAAVGSTGSLNFMVMGFCIGVCSGFCIPVSQAFGARDFDEMRKCVAHSVYLAAGIGAVMAVVTGVFCKTFLRWMSTPEDIIDGASAYIGVIFYFMPVTVAYNLAGGILRSLGDSKTPVYYLALASAINIGLDLLLIIKFGMGVAGAAVATVISQFVAGGGCIISIMRRFPILKLKRSDWQFDTERAARLLGIGVPMGLQFSITAIGSVILQSSVNMLGTVAVAAVAASSKLYMFFACVFDTLASTMATFAGQNIGAKKPERIGQGMRSAAVIGSIYSVVSLIAIWLWGRNLLSLFVESSQSGALEMAYWHLLISAAFFIPLLFVNILRLSIQGMGFTRLAVLAGVVEMIARTLVGLAFVPRFGFGAACFAGPAAWVLADAFLFPAFSAVLKRQKERMYPAGTNIAR